MHGDYVELLKKCESQTLTPESESKILAEVYRNVDKNGGVIEFDHIAVTLGVPSDLVKQVILRNKGSIQNAIANHPTYTQTAMGAFNKEIHNSHSGPTDSSNADGGGL